MAPGYRPICLTPLDFTAFDQYERGRTSAGNTLTRDSFTDAELECFVRRLVATTTDRRSIRKFTEAVKGKLWEDIRKILLSMDPKNLKPEEEEKRQDLLNFEFADRAVHGWGEVNIETSGEKTVRRDGTVFSNDSSNRTSMYALAGIQTLHLRGSWRVDSLLYVKGLQLWNSLQHMDAETATDNSFNFQNVESFGTLTLRRRDDRLKLSAYGLEMRQFNPGPDSIINSATAGGRVEVRGTKKVPLSFEATVDWSRKDFTAPYVPGYWQLFNQSLSLSGELSFLKQQWGGFATYKFTDSETDTSDSKKGSQVHMATLSAQRTYDAGFVRFGAGGGVWTDDFRYRSDARMGASLNGSEVHLTTTLKKDFNKTLTLQTDLMGLMKYSEGDINGWFPNWIIANKLTYHTDLLTVALLVNYNGMLANLDKYQQNHDVQFGLDEFAVKKDRFRFSLSARGRYTKQEGFSPFESLNLTTGGFLSAMLLKNPRLLTGVYGQFVLDQTVSGVDYFLGKESWKVGWFLNGYY